MMEMKMASQWEGRLIIQKTEDGKYIFQIKGPAMPEIAVIIPGTRDEMAESVFSVPDKKIGNVPGMPGGNADNLSGASGGTAGRAIGTSREPDSAAFAEYAEKWLAAVRGHVKESTYMKYWNQLYSYILPELGEKKWDTLSRDVVEEFCEDLLFFGGKKKRGLSPKTVSDVMSVVRSIFRYALGHGEKEMFDISGVTVKKKQEEMKVLSREDQDRLYRYLLSHPTPKNLGLLICLLMGLRLGEVCALKWEDVSFSDGTLFVHQTAQRVQTKDGSGKKTKIIFTSPKSASSVRRIPIPKELMKLLLALRKSPDSYILTGSPENFVEPRAMERHFDRILKDLEIAHVNFHALRHTFATNCVESGFDVKTLSEILGHSNVNITLNCYVHPTMEMKRENMRKLSAFMEAG